MPTCPEQLSGWAGNILDSLSETTVTTGSVVLWLQTHLGVLNAKLNTAFDLNESGCITGDMAQSQSGIYNEMFICDYYSKQAAKNLGASAYDWTVIEGEDQGSIKKVSKNEIAKTYRGLSTDCISNVNDLVKWYNSQYNKALPLQVLYNDRYDTSATALICSSPPAGLYSRDNYVFVNL